MGGGDMEREKKTDASMTQETPATHTSVDAPSAGGEQSAEPSTEPRPEPSMTQTETASKPERARDSKRPAAVKDEFPASKPPKASRLQRKLEPNSLREVRIEQMMSKAELARKAGLSVLTIDRIEKGFGCRMDTKRKILKALGLKLSDRRKVFKDD
jgi:DNA-binding XRE family transcriptional regulator